MGDINVAAFSGGGFALTEGFHTLTTDADLDEIRLYNAFVYGHGPANTHTSYGYLAGYDCKLLSRYIVCNWRYVALVVVLWRPALSSSSSSSSASVSALR